METVLVIVSQATDGTFWCRTEKEVYGCSLNGTGITVKEAKEDLTVCLEDTRTFYIEQGNSPYDVKFVYRYDMQSFFEYFSFLNISEIAKQANINPSLMRQYARGIKTAGEGSYKKLSMCMDSIIKDLQAVSFP